MNSEKIFMGSGDIPVHLLLTGQKDFDWYAVGHKEYIHEQQFPVSLYRGLTIGRRRSLEVRP